MMRVRDVDWKVKRFFPWGLFLALAALLTIASCVQRAHAEEDIWACYGSQRYQAMSSGWVPCNEMSMLCGRVQGYLQSHTVEEGRAEAARIHLPQWLRNKAERCIQK